MQTTEEKLHRGGFDLRYSSWRIVGVASPVFPGFEVDILDRVPDEQKPDAVWHRERARAILKAHPEVKNLFGYCRWTAVFCIAAAALQVALAATAGLSSWWVGLLMAYAIGAPLNIVLFQLAHECDHCLVFKKARWNRWLFTLTSLPMFLFGHHTWWVDHIIHHNDMGATKDFITRRRSFFLATRRLPPLLFPYAGLMLIAQVLRSLFGLVLYVATSLLRFRLQPTEFTLTVLADEHLVSGYRKEGIEVWAVVYPVLSFVMAISLVWFTGWMSLVYLLTAQLFFTGFLHPYSLGWVLGISHFHGRSNYQPTASHYGPLINLSTFNAGLHVEHHDLMAIPWFRLPELRRLAPEFYEDLTTIKSYTMLGLQFVFSRQPAFDANFNAESYRNYERFSGEPHQKTVSALQHEPAEARERLPF